MQVEWLKTARDNLDTEAAYIALDSPQAASDFVIAIRDSVERLSHFPAIGRESLKAGVRIWALPDWPYLIPYRVRSGKLQVLRIFHTSRRPPSQW